MINVFGAVFLDIYIDKNKKTEIIESIGGSGLNIALALHLLGNKVNFYGNIGDDERKWFIFDRLNKHKFPINNICINNGKTGLFIAQNDEVIAVERGVNDKALRLKELNGDYAIITTEIDLTSIKNILKYSWKKIFIDVGPRPFILKDIDLPKEVIKIGNEKENKIIKCDITKLGKNGCKWDDIYIPGNKNKYPYTIGCGDLFDAFLIHNLLKGNSKINSLKEAVYISEKSSKIKYGNKIETILK